MAFKDNQPAWEQGGAPMTTEMNPAYPRRILVVDADADRLRLNTEILLEAGYYVDFTSDGATAWDAVQLDKYDLLVTENQLPGLSGLDLLRNIHGASIELPAILVTDVSPAADFKRPPWLQVAAILLKPYTTDELLLLAELVLFGLDHPSQPTVLSPEWESQVPADDLRR